MGETTFVHNDDHSYTQIKYRLRHSMFDDHVTRMMTRHESFPIYRPTLVTFTKSSLGEITSEGIYEYHIGVHTLPPNSRTMSDEQVEGELVDLLGEPVEINKIDNEKYHIYFYDFSRVLTSENTGSIYVRPEVTAVFLRKQMHNTSEWREKQYPRRRVWDADLPTRDRMSRLNKLRKDKFD